MSATAWAPLSAECASEDSALDYTRALQNILEDSAREQGRLREAQSAVLNILEDGAHEKGELHESQIAMLNILEDLNEKKERLEASERAVLNILEDLAVEKDRLEAAQAGLVRSERAIRASLHEKETLLKEIHHRVKNNLQVIASLLRLQSRRLADSRVRATFEESQNRVLSISLVHEMLYQADDLARLDFGDYLRSLTTQLVSGGTSMVQLSVSASPAQLGVDTAIPCGLIVNELVTNALKHAFPGGRSGAIHVSLESAPDGWQKLSVRDNGIGIPEGMELGRSGSLGLELVATLVRQLQGRAEVRRDAGTTFEIHFQAPGR